MVPVRFRRSGRRPDGGGGGRRQRRARHTPSPSHQWSSPSDLSISGVRTKHSVLRSLTEPRTRQLRSHRSPAQSASDSSLAHQEKSVTRTFPADSHPDGGSTVHVARRLRRNRCPPVLSLRAHGDRETDRRAGQQALPLPQRVNRLCHFPSGSAGSSTSLPSPQVLPLPHRITAPRRLPLGTGPGAHEDHLSVTLLSAHVWSTVITD